MITVDDITLFDLDELTKKLKVSERTLRNYLTTGELKGRKVGRRWYVTEQALKNFLLTGQSDQAQDDQS